MKCIDFKPLARGSLLGFCDLEMDSGLVLLSSTFHQSNGKRWINPPGRPQLDNDRQLVVENGKLAYAPVIAFVTAALRYKWSAQAVAAVGEFLAAQSKEPATLAGSMTIGGLPQAANRGCHDE